MSMAIQKRPQIKTILAYGEGPDDKAFLRHIKRNYSSSHNNISVTIGEGGGGSPLTIARKIKKRKNIYRFDEGFILLDNDLFKKEPGLHGKINGILKGSNIDIIKNAPCLEGFLLSILLPGIEWLKFGSEECKKRFAGEIKKLTGKPLSLHQCDEFILKKIFPLDLLDKETGKNKNLDKIIKKFTKE